MPREILIKGVPLTVKDEDFDTICDTFKNVNLNFEDMSDWTTVTTDKQKFYDAEEFLKDAHYYYNQAPQNFIQTASKLWLGAVYVVKDYFLNISLHIVSHNSMRFLMDLAIKKCTSVEKAIRLKGGWERAEQFRNQNPN